MSLPVGLGGGQANYAGGRSDKGLSMPLFDTVRLAFRDPDLQQRLLFVLGMFAVFAFGVHIPVPVPGISAEEVYDVLKGLPAFGLLDVFGGGALRRVSIFALGLNPYITASIIIQILTQALPKWKKELQEGGEYARKQQNRKTRMLTLALCLLQGAGLLSLMKQAPSIAALPWFYQSVIVMFWTAGAMFVLWLGEQISERGIGNGVSLMIFVGIILSLPSQAAMLSQGVIDQVVQWWTIVLLGVIFLATTWFIVLFTTAQRRIPIQHMRRVQGTRQVGGATSYLPFSVNMAGVLPIIFAVSLVSLPGQFALMFGATPAGQVLNEAATWLNPASGGWKSLVGSIFYTSLIFFFSYFWTAIQYNVEDISNNLKRAGSFIPGVRPGKQTKEFLDGVISRVTIVGASFIAVVALLQYVAPVVAGLTPGIYITVLGGTSLLIMVQVALETMRQIEANLLMKQYGQ